MSDTHKIQIKLGDSEFLAEGSEKAVQGQYELFLKALAALPASPPGKNKNVNGDGRPLMPESEIDQAYLDRVFLRDEETGGVSLRILPRTDKNNADALIVLLYGYRVLSERHDVTSGDLLGSARLSGLTFGRLDHTIKTHQSLITEGGLRRGKKYGLNNQGVNHAEKTIRGMFE